MNGVFVVAGIKDDRGMIAQVKRRRPCLLALFFDESGVVVGIVAASHEKILRKKNAASVASCIEGFFFKQTAAPNAEHIHIGLDGKVKEPFDFFVGFFGGERRAGHPVAAAAKDRHVVDEYGKAGGDFVVVAVLQVLGFLEFSCHFLVFSALFVGKLQNDDFTNAENRRMLACRRFEFQGVEGLGAVSLGIPKFRVADVQNFVERRLKQRAFFLPNDLALRRFQSDFEYVAAVAKIADFHVKTDLRAVGRDGFGIDVGMNDGVLFVHRETHVAKNAHSDETGDPIPPVGALDASGVHALGGESGAAFGLARYRADRRKEFDGEGVFAYAKRPVGTKRTGKKHILAVPYLLAVEKDVGVGVKPVKLEKRILFDFVEREGFFVGKIAVFNPLTQIGVISVKRIGNHTRLHKIGMNAAGNRGFDFEILAVWIQAGQLPFSA